MQHFKERADLGNCLEVLLSVLYHKLINAGDVVIDGGANGGLHAIPMARLAGPQGRVFAYEPQPQPFSLMSKWASNVSLCVVPRNIAIGKSTGSLTFYEHKTNDGLSSARVMDGKPDNWNAVEIPVVRVDDESIPARVSFIKLDLEGGEFDALSVHSL
jgi:FkbM family methyltransferase